MKLQIVSQIIKYISPMLNYITVNVVNIRDKIKDLQTKDLCETKVEVSKRKKN